MKTCDYCPSFSDVPGRVVVLQAGSSYSIARMFKLEINGLAWSVMVCVLWHNVTEPQRWTSELRGTLSFTSLSSSAATATGDNVSSTSSSHTYNSLPSNLQHSWANAQCQQEPAQCPPFLSVAAGEIRARQEKAVGKRYRENLLLQWELVAFLEGEWAQEVCWGNQKLVHLAVFLFLLPSCWN